MENLRIVAVVVIDSTNIKAKFTHNLAENINTSNISISSQTPGVPDVAILVVSVDGDTLNIETQPLTPYAAYYITFSSTSSIPFRSLNGDAILLNNSIANKQLIIGPVETDNPINEYLTNFFRNNVYDLEAPSSMSKYIQGLSSILYQSLSDIRQSKNENYLSYNVVDEAKVRSPGPFDRLNEGSAYEITRVGKGKTDALATSISPIASFPSYPVSLLAATNSEQLVVNSTNENGTFNLDTFTLTLEKSPLIILNSVIFVYSSSTYVYDIPTFGYQIKDSKYDPNFAFTYLAVDDNQIRLNDAILNDANFSTQGIVSVNVSYQFKDNGRVIDPNTVAIYTVIKSTREVMPPIENIFALKHAPIVSDSGIPASVGGLTLTNPNVPAGYNIKHPAFLYEIPFRLDYIPSRPGEYSVDYPNGTLYVFGETISDGTGPTPPLATYSYTYDFKPSIDYVYDSDTSDIVSLPNGSLREESAIIAYDYEEVLVQGVDYVAATHVEALNERIGNNLVALNAIRPSNFPVSNVFRIFNETSGEVYRVLRWTDNKIYFNYSKAPNIISLNGERASFQVVNNEVLLVSEAAPIDLSHTLFKMFLNNDNIIAGTEDCIGSSFNTTVSFSNANLFSQEIYFDENLSEASNNARLIVDGYYQVDYINGVVWCRVPSTQSFAVGTVSYKRGHIDPINPHVISVNDIYYRDSVLTPKKKNFTYSSFSDDNILPSSFDVSNEGFLNNNIELPYQISSNQIGVFENASFIAGVSNPVKFIRGIYEQTDLLNNISPLNFAVASTYNGATITVNPLSYSEYHTVQFDGTNYYVLADTALLYQSPNITTTISITRLTDTLPLWNGSGTIVFGSPFKLVLPGINSPTVGDPVSLSYSYTINNLSRVIADYNRGDYYIDYTYLADEIIISYEYGNNALDFRQSNALSAGDNYFVSYKVGALRDALLKNFGTLINIPILNSLDTSFERERYRDALMAAMQSFTAGPTVQSIKNIVSTIVHTPPKITESAFQNWSVGNSLLSREAISTSGAFDLVPAKYGNGVVIDTPGQTVTFPTSSNLRIEEGTLECWIIPKWNGIDNQSKIDINITKDGYTLPLEQVFIGPSAHHPTSLPFSLDTSQKSAVAGIPNQSKDGVFIYYKADQSGMFDRWFFDVIDGYGDGYGVKDYTIAVSTNGKLYDVKSTSNPKPASDKIQSGTNKFTYTITGLSQVNQGITFVADSQHYIYDFGKPQSNRFSLFKDESGYMNFRVIDEDGISYNVSADISAWKAGQQHHIATSWRLNSKNGRDELHLFIDGFEVPNIIKYGGRVQPYFHEKYRTVDPEEIIGVISKPIISSTDLSTTLGSNVVSSSIDFGAYGILSGDTIYIEEPGFSTPGYTISIVNGQSLTLSSSMPSTITDGKFSVNKLSFEVKTEIDLYPNITVSLLHAITSNNDLTTSANSNVVSSLSSNFTALGIKPGYLIRIVEANLPSHYTIASVSGSNLTLTDNVPDAYSNASFFVYSNVEQEIPGVRALHPAYEISRDGYSILTIRNDALKDDIALIRTLGMNHRRIRQRYYVWGSSNNVIMTRLPSPMLLDDVKITHILLAPTNIGPSNSTFTTVFTSNHIPTDQPSLSNNGRTLSCSIAGSNVDFTTSPTITIHGTINNVPASSETLTFTENGSKSTANKFNTVDYIVVVCKPINSSKNCLVVEVKEAYPITTAENSVVAPVIRFSYQVNVGTTLFGSASTVTDTNAFFSVLDVGNYLVIHSPPSVVGQYAITGVSSDHKTLTLSTSLPMSFTGGSYEILNTTSYRSGLQNGFFTFEDGYQPGTAYNLVQGLYEFDYYSYLSIPIHAGKFLSHIGTDVNSDNLSNSIIDELVIRSEKIVDTRIGEIVGLNQTSITKDFNSLKPIVSDVDTLMLCHFDTFPFKNETDVYITASNKFIQSSNSVNDNFDKSISILNNPIVVDNTGILTTQKEGTIEFWVNPIYDTSNDPNYRFYFDASSIVSEKTTSTNNATVKVQGRASQILNIKLQTGNTDVDFFAGGSIDSDGQTIFLNKALPNQETPIIVNYVPTGVNGDRISIFKDPSGSINFNVRASNIDYQIRAPIFWSKNTWHRLKASYKFNGGIGNDEIRLFIDGYERGNLLFGNGLLFGQNQVFGSSFVGEGNIIASIVFKDTINELYIGSDYSQRYGAYALLDNIRISNISRPLFRPFGESIDVGYSSNMDIVLPVVEDLYTTLLLDFATLVQKTDDFAILKNKKTGLTDFAVQIADEFNIVSDNATVKEVLETLLQTLKPASSRILISYIK